MPRDRYHAELQLNLRRQVDHRFRPAPESGSLAELARRNNRSSALTPDSRERRALRQQDTMPLQPRTGGSLGNPGARSRHRQLAGDEMTARPGGDWKSADGQEHGLDHEDDDDQSGENGGQDDIAEDTKSEQDSVSDAIDDDDVRDLNRADTMSLVDETEMAMPSIGGITDRSWVVDHVGGHRQERGIVDYLVHWAPSRHPTCQVEIQINRGGGQSVLVDGAPWPVSRVTPDVHDGDQTWVEWEATWHSTWDLRCALKAIARYRKRPLFHLGQTWLFTERFHATHDPEPDGKFGPVDGHVIYPQEGLDYTRSLLALLKQEYGNDSIHITSSVATNLNMPARQQLTFRPEFVAQGMSYIIHANSLLAATTYVAGYARETPCERCTSGATLPFPKCVTMPNYNNGACVNCSLSKFSVSCTHRPDVQWQLMARPDEDVEDDEDDEDEEDDDGDDDDEDYVGLHAEWRPPPDEGDLDSDGRSACEQRPTMNDAPIRPDPVSFHGSGLEVLDLSHEDPDGIFALLNANSTAAAPGPDAPISPSSRPDGSTSESSPLPGYGVLESSPDAAGKTDGTVSSQQTSTSPYNAAPTSSQTGAMSRKRQRDSDVSAGPSRRLRRCWNSSRTAIAQQVATSRHHVNAATRSAERTSSLDIIFPDMPDENAPLSEKVVAIKEFSHIECPSWLIRCQHPFNIFHVKPEAASTSLPAVETGRFVPINRPGLPRSHSFSAEPSSSSIPRDSKQVIFRGQHFAASELTELQIQYILSCCPCRTTQLLHDAWEEAREERPERTCKFRYLSVERVEEMNAVIERFCPVKKGTKEHPIVL